jgi:hypothetical protein
VSEYQYYEFQAIDRPLTAKELADLRALSTRATITTTRFVNVYNWGDFKGNPRALMEQCFDAFLYVANWGTHWFMLRLPRRLLDPQVAARYCAGECAAAHATREHVILEFRSEDEEGEFDEGEEECLPALIPLRADLAAGDLRALYLGWLLCAQSDLLDEDTVEPPVPPGLGQLSAALKAFADFLRVDEDLLAVAAQRSPVLQETNPEAGRLEAWIRALPHAEKDALLVEAAHGRAAHLQAELLRRFREAAAPATPVAGRETGGRTVASLLDAADKRADARRLRQHEREARERARREKEAAAARAAYLDGLAGSEPDLWRQVDALIDAKQPARYDQAVTVLKDLSDLAVRQDGVRAFETHLQELRLRHARKPSLIQRLDRAFPGRTRITPSSATT